jgi:hypothetical protein
MAIDSTEPFSGWTNIFQVTSVQDGWVTERYPGIWFAEGGTLHVAQSFQKPSSAIDYNSNSYLDGEEKLEAGETYKVKVTNVDSLLSMSIYKDGNLVEEKSIQGADTYTPAGGAGVLYAGSPWYTAAKAKLSDVRYSEIISYALNDNNLWPEAQSSTPLKVGACGCPADFPYQSTVLTETCFNSQAYASAGTGPCGSWCTFDVAVGSGCGDNSGNMCSDACNYDACNLGSIHTPKNYELSFTIAIDDNDSFAGADNWRNIILVTEGSVTSRWPSVTFENTDPPVRMQVFQSRTSSDWGAYVSSTTLFERGETYDVKMGIIPKPLVTR